MRVHDIWFSFKTKKQMQQYAIGKKGKASLAWLAYEEEYDLFFKTVDHVFPNRDGEESPLDYLIKETGEWPYHADVLVRIAECNRRIR